jgi:hypothetical protein
MTLSAPQPDGVKLIARVGPAIRTVKGAILTAGALAVALAAIWALVPNHKPVKVRFLSVDLSPAPVPLGQFRPTEGKYAPIAHSSGLQWRPLAVVQTAQGDVKLISRVDSIGLTSTAPSTEHADSTTTPTSPTMNSTEPWTSPTDSTTTSSTGPTAATTPTTTGSGGRSGPFDLPKSYVSDVLERVRAAGFRVGSLPIAIPARGAETGPDGKRLPAREAARRVIKALTHVRARNNGGKTEPLGVVLRVRMELVNARDVPVLIYWEMAGAGSRTQSLTDEWLRDTAAYELRATDDDDSGTFKLWIPLPKEKGNYKVSLDARTANDELPGDSISTTIFH